MDEMKAMLGNADPDAVREVAQAWKSVHDQLVGDGSIKATLEAAVDHILQHWEGTSADGFAAQAKKISKKLTDGATYASHTSTAMESAATALAHIKPQVDAMQKPSESSSIGDHLKDAVTGHDRSDAGLKSDLASGASTQDALDNNRGDLSKGKEAQLEMAVKMETLAAAYSTQTQTMGSWTKEPATDRWRRMDDEDYPGDPGGDPPVAFVPVAVESPTNTTTSRSSSSTKGSTSSSSKAVTSPNVSGTTSRETGISGGTRQQTSVSKPQVGTGLDGISGTVTGGGTVGGSASGIGAAARGSVGGTIGGSSAAAMGAFGGVSGGSVGSGAGTAGRTGTTGRTGTGGRGLSGQSGAGAGKTGAADGTGKGRSLVRQKSGVVGAAKGGAGKGAQGGSGLHKSRGAKGAGKVGKGSGRLGGRGANSEAGKEETRENKRPDYLVEDEETWLPDRDVAPKVIE